MFRRREITLVRYLRDCAESLISLSGGFLNE